MDQPETKTKEKIKEENLKDPFWVMRDITQGDYDNQELYDMYVEMNLFKSEEEQQQALNYIADMVLLDMEDEWDI